MKNLFLLLTPLLSFGCKYNSSATSFTHPFEPEGCEGQFEPVEDPGQPLPSSLTVEFDTGPASTATFSPGSDGEWAQFSSFGSRPECSHLAWSYVEDRTITVDGQDLRGGVAWYTDGTDFRHGAKVWLDEATGILGDDLDALLEGTTGDPILYLSFHDVSISEFDLAIENGDDRFVHGSITTDYVP